MEDEIKKQFFVGATTLEEIKPVVNRQFIKPFGGFWTSTYTPEEEHPSAWADWCSSEMPDKFKKESMILTVKKDARIFVIDSLDDVRVLWKKYPLKDAIINSLCLLDWEKISQDYDGVQMTSKGQWDTRMPRDMKDMHLSLYGWDVESTLWFRNVFEKIEKYK